MITGKKLAQKFRGKRQIIIVSPGNIDYDTNNRWAVTDAYFLAFIGREELIDFIEKYNSYKTTTNIPADLFEKGAVRILEDTIDYEYPDIASVIPDIPVDSEAMLYNSEIKLYNNILYQTDEEIPRMVALSPDYTSLVDNNLYINRLADRIDKSPVVAYSSGIIEAVILPIINYDRTPEQEIADIIMGKN